MQTKRSVVDRIIETIDVGLQTPMPDPSFGEISPKNREECWRCSRRPPAEESASGLCEPCRTFMLGDSSADPVVAQLPSLTPEQYAAIAEEIAQGIKAFVDSFMAAMQQVASTVSDIVRIFQLDLEEIPPLDWTPQHPTVGPTAVPLPNMDNSLGRSVLAAASSCPRHGPMPGGLCRPCVRAERRR